MCGIAGFFNYAHAAPEAAPRLLRMLALIAHRGPDEFGVFCDTHVGMATARLCIVGIASGQQPLKDVSGRYVIAFNGEVYNFRTLRTELEQTGVRFRTESDTEVLLQAWLAWGEAGLARLNGGFACAIYDTVEQTLVLARDAFGKRPLFYVARDGRWAFASEMKAMLALPEVEFALDAEALSTALGCWTLLPDQSPFRHMYQVLPGHCIRIATDGQFTVSRFSRPAPPPAVWTFEAACEGLREHLTRAVDTRLHAEVEVGAYLSGGIDSSVLCAVAQKLLNGRLRTFSVEFEDGAYDESPEQGEVARFLGTRHESLRIGNRHIADAFPEALWHAEVPLFRTALVPLFLLSKQVRDAGIKVVLTGEGADEVLLGYEIFKETRIREAWSGYASNQERLADIRRLYAYLPHFQDDRAQSMLQFFQEHSLGTDTPLFSHQLRLSNARFNLRLLRQPVPFQDRLVETMGPQFPSLSPVRRAQEMEFVTLLAGYLLSSQGDRMSLGHSVEGRCPFLDPELVDFARTLPEEFCLGTDLTEKRLLREAFGTVVPPTIASRTKQPYRAPDLAPFLSERPDYLDVVCSAGELRKLDLIDSTFAERLIGKIMRTAPEQISPREEQAFVFLLSIGLLSRTFVHQTPVVGDAIHSRLVVMDDVALPRS